NFANQSAFSYARNDNCKSVCSLLRPITASQSAVCYARNDNHCLSSLPAVKLCRRQMLLEASALLR
ncbi:hypothetical protein DPMN_053255, partial [Dreissena polymorpha]